MNNGEKLQRRPSLKFRKSFKSKKARQQMADRTCNELALEGEHLCREGQWEEGVQRLEAATRTGTSDLKTLSALYSQLGNAYFYLEEYGKALEYHKQDLGIARSMADKLGEAKACGNIGSALKALGQFEEAVACCRMQLDLAREIGDKVLESRALYNLGNVYHARGKHASLHASGYSQQEVDDFVRSSLEQAARHYEANLKLVRELGDQQAQGRTVGNLGNTYYLLGNYKKAIKYHEERLSIADVLNDTGARRRAYSNLGNAHVFLGKYSLAAHHYQNALEIAREIRDAPFEAQSCYSLGNTYTLMQNYHKAIEYHMLHMQFAMQLEDKIGEARACWSLGNAYTALGDHRMARHFAEKHLHLSVELGDEEGVVTAKQNLTDLDNVLELSDKYECVSPKVSAAGSSSAASFNTFSWSWSSAPMGIKRKLKAISSTGSIRSERSSKAQSPDTCSELTGSPDSALGRVSVHEPSPILGATKDDVFPTDDGFFDMITRFQGHRLDDQRTSLPPALAAREGGGGVRKEEDDLLEVLWQVQGSRIEEQRCHMTAAPHVMPATQWEEAEAECLSADELFEMIFTCQSSRINDQRSPNPVPACHKSTMPSEDFFNLIQHLQSTRIEDQRSPLPILAS